MFWIANIKWTPARLVTAAGHPRLHQGWPACQELCVTRCFAWLILAGTDTLPLGFTLNLWTTDLTVNQFCPLSQWLLHFALSLGVPFSGFFLCDVQSRWSGPVCISCFISGNLGCGWDVKSEKTDSALDRLSCLKPAPTLGCTPLVCILHCCSSHCPACPSYPSSTHFSMRPPPSPGYPPLIHMYVNMWEGLFRYREVKSGVGYSVRSARLQDNRRQSWEAVDWGSHVQPAGSSPSQETESLWLGVSF